MKLILIDSISLPEAKLYINNFITIYNITWCLFQKYLIREFSDQDSENVFKFVLDMLVNEFALIRRGHHISFSNVNYKVISKMRIYPSEITMKILGCEVTYKEIKEIYDDIKKYYNTNDLQICMGLKIANDNVDQWHNEIVDFFKSVVEKVADSEKVTYGQFFGFTHKKERVPVSERSSLFLRSERFE